MLPVYVLCSLLFPSCPRHFCNHLQEAAGKGAELVILPEMWNCPYSNDSFPTYAEDIEGGASPSVDALAQVRAHRAQTSWPAGDVVSGQHGHVELGEAGAHHDCGGRQQQSREGLLMDVAHIHMLWRCRLPGRQV